MRLFWIVVGLLVASGVALLVVGRDRAPAPAEQPPIVASAPVHRVAPTAGLASATPATSAAPVPSAPTQGTTIASSVTPGSFESKVEVMNAPPTPPPAAATTPPQAMTEAPKQIQEPQSDSVGAAPSASPGPQTTTQSKQLPPAFGSPPPAPLGVEKRADGSSLLDGRFAITGDGSEEKPYTISWALLVSAAETYKPKQGKTALPERITMLNDKYVRITGYIAFPFMAQQATEMLAMQNQWDGCCIGVPPTPYDAIEVSLRRPTVGDERLMQFGVVEGKLKVEAYLRGDWLISLYSMTDARMSPEM